MGRGAMTRRWIAGAGGVLVNVVVLAGLAWLEHAPPAGEIPVMIVDLECPIANRSVDPRQPGRGPHRRERKHSPQSRRRRARARPPPRQHSPGRPP